MNDCTIVVNSCDAYEDLWLPFFTLLKRRWPDCPYPVLLNTESREFHLDGLDIRRAALQGAPASLSWSDRLRQTLKQVDTPFVLLLLDDFFLESPVDTERFAQCLAWMKNDAKLACFSFVPTIWPNVEDGKYPGFQRRPRRAAYTANCQAGLWRTKTLLKLLRRKENLWEFEEYATIRANHTNLEFYAAAKDAPLIMDYDWRPGGAVHRGKWTRHVPQLLQEIGVPMDLSLRGTDTAPIAEYQEENLQMPSFYRYQMGRIWGCFVKKVRGKRS